MQIRASFLLRSFCFADGAIFGPGHRTPYTGGGRGSQIKLTAVVQYQCILNIHRMHRLGVSYHKMWKEGLLPKTRRELGIPLPFSTSIRLNYAFSSVCRDLVQSAASGNIQLVTDMAGTRPLQVSPLLVLRLT